MAGVKTLFLTGFVALAMAGCADDGSDHGVEARLLAERLAASKAAETSIAPTTTEVRAEAPATGAAPATVTTVPVAAPTTAPAVEPTGVVVPVLALDNSFRPEVVEVNVGDEVVWENRGQNEHDVLYVQDSAAPFGVEVADFQPGDIYSHVFTEPGTFRYYCSIHGNETVGMVGAVVVTG